VRVSVKPTYQDLASHDAGDSECLNPIPHHPLLCNRISTFNSNEDCTTAVVPNRQPKTQVLRNVSALSDARVRRVAKLREGALRAFDKAV
jgi:hypothetical protein